MPPEVLSQPPSQEHNMGGLHRAMTTWNSVPHQVTDARGRIRSKKTDKNTTYGTAGTVKRVAAAVWRV